MKSFAEYLDEVALKLRASPYVDRTEAFVKEFNAMGSKLRKGTRIRAGGTSVYVELIPFAGVVHISEISIPNSKQGQGVGHKVMKIITDLADKRGLPLGLFPSPIAQGPDEDQIPKTKLVKFYKDHGFKMEGSTMKREPMKTFKEFVTEGMTYPKNENNPVYTTVHKILHSGFGNRLKFDAKTQETFIEISDSYSALITPDELSKLAKQKISIETHKTRIVFK